MEDRKGNGSSPLTAETANFKLKEGKRHLWTFRYSFHWSESNELVKIKWLQLHCLGIYNPMKRITLVRRLGPMYRTYLWIMQENKSCFCKLKWSACFLAEFGGTTAFHSAQNKKLSKNLGTIELFGVEKEVVDNSLLATKSLNLKLRYLAITDYIALAPKIWVVLYR